LKIKIDFLFIGSRKPCAVIAEPRGGGVEEIVGGMRVWRFGLGTDGLGMGWFKF
jgi:hypothetical protein